MTPRSDVKRRPLECALHHEPLIKVLPISIDKVVGLFVFCFLTEFISTHSFITDTYHDSIIVSNIC